MNHCQKVATFFRHIFTGIKENYRFMTPFFSMSYVALMDFICYENIQSLFTSSEIIY